MTDTKRGFQGMPVDTTSLNMIEVGDLLFAVEYRYVGSEEGPSVHIFGEIDGTQEEILRFDCFNKAPHYHYGFSYIDQPATPIDATAVGDPLAWVCGRIQKRLPQMLSKAGAPMLGANCDPARLEEVAATLEKRAHELTPASS
ncbi:MAG: hypothetical protein VX211_06225 [Pseudomonadota bacterium]|nr:hypothetical protein [Pseudomonadota bacterium]